MSEQKGRSFIKGTAILTASTFVVKFINIFFAIPLSNFLGGEGMGHFYNAYDIFIFFSVVTTSGTPVAISRMVSMAYAQGRKKEADKIFRVSFLLFTVIGVICCLVMFFFSPQFSVILSGEDRSMYAIAGLAPTVFFLSLSSCLRGYFQGREDMVPTAVSQVIESIVKLVVGVGLALYLLNRTQLPEIGAAGAIVGVSVGAFVALIYAVIYLIHSRKKTYYMVREPAVSSTSAILKDILLFAVPVVIGSSFLSALDLVDKAVMMDRLQNAAGISYSQAMSMNGLLGNARKYFDLPNAVVVPISTMVLPMLAGVIAKKDRGGIRHISNLAIRMTLMVAVPAAVGLCVFARPICGLLLMNQPEDAANTAPLLAVMAPAVITASLLYTTNAMIQAVGKVYVPIINMAVGTVVRIVLVWVLCGIPQIAVLGSAIATLASYFVMIVLNMISVHKLLPGITSAVKTSVRPALAALLMVAVSLPAYWLFSALMGDKIAVVVAIVLAVIVYALAAVLTKAVTRDEVVHLPKGERIAALLRMK